MAGRGSRHHSALDRRKWAAARRAALRRSGYRSELSGKAGRLEVHHRVRLEDGGDPYSLNNLQILTRGEHIELHRKEALDRDPERAKWRALVAELLVGPNGASS